MSVPTQTRATLSVRDIRNADGTPFTGTTPTPTASVGEDFTGYIPSDLGSNDDGPAIQACIDRMPNRGARLIIPAASLKVNSQVNVYKQLTIEGQGAHDNRFYSAVSEITTTNPTLDVFNVTAPGCTIEKLGIINLGYQSGVVPTAGSAVKVDIQAPLNFERHPEYETNTGEIWEGIRTRGTLPGSIILDKSSFFGFYDNVKQINAQECKFLNLRFGAAVNNALYYENVTNPDGGDSCVDNCDFNAQIWNSNAGIRQVSGGGLKLTNNKFNGGGGKKYKKQYHGTMPNSTSILLFDNNSFENFAENAVYVATTGFQMVKVMGNQFAPYAAVGSYVYIENVRGIEIGDNIFRNGSNGGTQNNGYFLSGCDSATITPNQWLDYTNTIGAYQIANSTKVRNFDV